MPGLFAPHVRQATDQHAHTNAQQAATQATLQAGYGMGITKTQLVCVFEREADLRAFVENGYELGASVDLQVNPGTAGGLFGGAVEAQPGVWLYQLSEAGLALDLTVEGTKYFKYPELN